MSSIPRETNIPESIRAEVIEREMYQAESPPDFIHDPVEPDELPLVLMVEDNIDLIRYIKKELSEQFNIVEAEMVKKDYHLHKGEYPTSS
jgi:hypothetical protein